MPKTLSWEIILQKRCPQLSVTFFSVDRTSYAFHAAVLISRVFVIDYLKCLDFICGSQHVVNIPCTVEKKQRFPGWVWVKHAMRRDPASWTAFSCTVQNSDCWGKATGLVLAFTFLREIRSSLAGWIISLNVNNKYEGDLGTNSAKEWERWEEKMFSVVSECVSSP